MQINVLCIDRTEIAAIGDAIMEMMKLQRTCCNTRKFIALLIEEEMIEQKILQQIGFVHEVTFPKYLYLKGRYLTAMAYSHFGC
ncbi:hypothetical protein WT83_28930 [Burkholderia territorii]|uniref:Uncharacterized protein n=2 Tax=Burkholderia territorii TaxID=1503055 RepID=A0A108E6I3_9BURK|nr:hypothetical protein WT83_28930 [Burkholderia territorii]